MSERDFAESLIAYAGHNAKKRIKMMRRVKKEFKESQKVGQVLLRLNFNSVAKLVSQSPGLKSDVWPLTHFKSTTSIK